MKSKSVVCFVALVILSGVLGGCSRFEPEAFAAATSQEPLGPLSGTWKLAVDLKEREGGTATLELEQRGTEIRGLYRGGLGKARLKGTVNGTAVHLSFASAMGDVTYDGHVDEGLFEGSCDYGRLGPGTFTGKRDA